MFTFILREIDIVDIDTATLIESINYQNFLRAEKDYNYLFIKTYEDIPTDLDKNKLIPVGTIEWVKGFIDYFKLNTNNFKPIYEKDIQTHLFKLSLDELIKKLMFTNKEYFVKETEGFKSTFADTYGYLFNSDSMGYLSKSEYFVSNKLNIVSEYRLFVFNGVIKGIYNYSGDFLTFPNSESIEVVNDAINKFKSHDLKAYTLDIAITKNKTYVLEIHPFFSCGLYGFNDLSIIPQMYISGFKYLIK